MLGVVEHVELAADHVPNVGDERGDERVDRAVTLAVDRVGLAVDLELRLDRRAAGAAVVVAAWWRTSWLRSLNDGSAGRYCAQNSSHMRAGLISVPESSVMCWIVLENSIWNRRGRSNPCSVFIT